MFALLYKILANTMRILARLSGLEGLAKGIAADVAALGDRDGQILAALAEQRDATERQRSLLEQILAEVIPPPGAVQIAFNVTYHGKPSPGATTMQIKDNEEFDVTLSFTDAKGKPAKVDGVPEWTVDNPNVVTLTVAADGMSATVTAGDVGTCQVSVSADSDLGAGATTITGVLPVEVLGGDASVIQLNPGTPRVQGSAPTPAPTP